MNQFNVNAPTLPAFPSTVIAVTLAFMVVASVYADDRVLQMEGFTADEKNVAAPTWLNHGWSWRVRCDQGQSIGRALKWAGSNDRVTFYGTCFESIVVTTDNLTIQGAAGAKIDGSQSPAAAVVTVDGARGFTLNNFTVRNASDQGVLVTHQAQGAIKDLTIELSGSIGLSVDRSHLEIQDLTIDNNQTGGLDAFAGSTVVAMGNISASNNGGDGLAVNGKSFLELRGANVTTSDNAGSGVSIINDSRLQIFSFPEAQGSSITANGNGFAGIGLMGAELGVVGSQYFGSGANIISASNNGVFGFFMPAGAILSPHATAKFVAKGNAFGMLLEDGASALIVGGLDISNNATGISAHGAGTLNLVSVPPNPSVVDGNAADLDLGFGTRLTADGLGFSSLNCDSTVLVRGAVCP